MEFEIKDGLMVKINKSNNTASIISSPKATGDVFIPHFFENDNIQYKIISIGFRAFRKCNIDSITFPDDSEIEVFGNDCFYLSTIKKLQIPSSVNKIDGCFNFINDLQEIELSKNNDHFILYNNQYLLGKSDENDDKFDVLHFGMFNLEEAVIPSQIRLIKAYSFYQHKKLKSIKFEANSQLQIIERVSFSNTKIENLTFPPSVEVIENESFIGTSNLKSVIFPLDSKLKKIGDNAFYKSSIVKLSLPESVEYLSDQCFAFTPNLNEIDISTNNKSFKLIKNDYLVKETIKGSGVFDVIVVARRDLESINIPSHIKMINYFAFNDCKKLKSIVFETNSSLELILDFAFCFFSSEKLVLPSSLKEVGYHSFFSNNNLKHAEFLSKSIKIKYKCFGFCRNISSVVFTNADQIVFEKNAMSDTPDNMKILVRKNAELSGDGLDNCKSKIYYIEDIEEERKKKEKEIKIKKQTYFCASCKKPIETDQYIYYSGYPYHSHCVKCSICNKTFSFGDTKDKYICISPGTFLCIEHYGEQIAPKPPKQEFMTQYIQKKKDNMFDELFTQPFIKVEDTNNFSPEEILITKEMIDNSIQINQYERIIPTISLYVDKPSQEIDCDKLLKILGENVAILNVEKKFLKIKSQDKKTPNVKEIISTIITIALLSCIDLDNEKIDQEHQNYVDALKNRLKSSNDFKDVIGNFVLDPIISNPNEQSINAFFNKPSINQFQDKVKLNLNEIREVRKRIIEKIKKDNSIEKWKIVFSHADLYYKLKTQIHENISNNPFEMIITGQKIIPSIHFIEYERIKDKLKEDAFEQFLFHGIKYVETRNTENYATDNILYASMQSNGCNLLEINENANIICCKSIHNKHKINNVTDLSILDEEFDKDTKKNFGVNHVIVGNTKNFKPINENDIGKNEIWANEFVFFNNYQIIPFYSFKVIRKDHYILWKDEKIEDEQNSQLLNKLSESIDDINIYDKKTVDEALDLIRKKKYAAVKLITNSGFNIGKTGEKLINQAREIIGSNFICMVYAFDVRNMEWISKMENVFLITTQEEFNNYVRLNMNIDEIRGFIDDITKKYKGKYDIKINEEELLHFPNCENNNFYNSYNHQNTKKPEKPENPKKGSSFFPTLKLPKFW